MLWFKVITHQPFVQINVQIKLELQRQLQSNRFQFIFSRMFRLNVVHKAYNVHTCIVFLCILKKIMNTKPPPRERCVGEYFSRASSFTDRVPGARDDSGGVASCRLDHRHRPPPVSLHTPDGRRGTRPTETPLSRRDKGDTYNATSISNRNTLES